VPRQLTQAEYQQIWAHGPKAEFVPAALITSLQSAGSIPASGSFTSPLFSADGYYDFSIGLTSSQAGNLTLLRFIDDAGTTALDGGQTVALTGGTPAVPTVTDGKPFAACEVKVTSTGSSAATLSGLAVLTSAH
jgi:hypothetical protein